MNTALLRRRDRIAVALVLTFVFLRVPCWGEETIVITFDGPPTQPPGSVYSVTSYYERGFSCVGNFSRAQPPGLTGRPDNGTSYIQPTGIFLPTGAPATFSRFDNLSFRLVSVDLATYSAGFPDDTASFEGHRSDGSIVTTNFAVSGLAFQTYYFSSEFADLTNVLAAAGSLDNLVTRVPSIPAVLTIGTYSYNSDSWMTLHVQGTVGLRYRLEYADRLAATNWTTVTNFETSYSRMDYITTNLPVQRFYRAVELP